MLVRILLALLLMVHGVPVSALASVEQCGHCGHGFTIGEGDHCARRKPVADGEHCARMGAQARKSRPDPGGRVVLRSLCTCRHAQPVTPSTSDPLLRPLALSVERFERAARYRPVSPGRSDDRLPAPPSPPPRPFGSG
jgi:hypothetical protein